MSPLSRAGGTAAAADGTHAAASGTRAAASPSADRTSYVGRALEMAETRRLLADNRLVTLTGPGGVGKTRLAVRVMRDVEAGGEFADRAFFVGLSELRDADLVPTAVADRLGLHTLSGRPAMEFVTDHLRARAVLLVLDNCEHLLDGCAQFVGAVLAACPRVAVLATSRQSLGVDGEQVLPVPPLEVPYGQGPESLAELAECDSVRLFADRARAVLPGFEVTGDNRGDVVSLTQRLEGVPLAIELAAARVRSLSPRQIVKRLDRQLPILTSGARTAPQRQQTLRATIDWSYHLCTEAERLVWARASMFSGSFELEAAEYVCGGEGLDGPAVLDLIDGLLDKSVLSRGDHGGPPRYRMLETLREYGQERLADAGESAQVARRHRDWYDTLTARFRAEWLGPDQLVWLDRLPRDLANIWVALEFCVSTTGEAATAVRMLERIRPYWTVFGYMDETRRFVERALANLPANVPEYRTAVWIAGFLAVIRGNMEVATRQFNQARELAEQAGDEALAAEITFSWGIGMFLADRSAQAVPLLHESLAAYRAHNFLEGELNALCFGGFARGFSGDIDGARTMLHDSVARSKEAGEIYFQGWAMCALGYSSLEGNNIDDAEKFGRLALKFSSQTGSWFIAATTMHMLAWTATRRKRFQRAVTLFGAADVIWASIDLQARSFPIWVARLDRYEALTKQALGDAAYARNYADGRAMSTETAVSYALDGKQPDSRAADRGGLTRREQEVAELIAQGLTNREIAAQLVIAKRTADTHVDHILTKLGLSNRVQIAAWVANRHSST